jgi:nifR3 family TIM-barrel protein
MVKIRNIELGKFPILLAPMEDITGAAFRKICKDFGADVVYTEFVAADGLIRDVQKSTQKIDFQDIERPIGIQIFGNDESSMRRAAEVAAEQNPDIIDINWGCPVKKVVKKCSGSGMLQFPERLVKITESVVKSVNIPVTVKTRLGWDESNKPIVTLSEQLQDVGIEAITIHGRTRAQLYSGVADWTLIGKIKENPRMKIPVFGNGDVNSPEKALEMKQKYGVDGVMIGRAAIGNPFIFREIQHYLKAGQLLPPPTIKERIEVCKTHLLNEISNKNERAALLEMRRQYSGYFKGIADVKSFRIQLVESDNIDSVIELFDKMKNFLKP